MCWFNFQCDQTDVDSALPYAGLEEVIHIKPPVGVRVPSGCVLRFKKAFYGLKQAPRAWYQLVTSALIDFGFTKCVSDPCIFLCNVEKTWLWSEVYVYDILNAGNNRAVINES